MLFSKHSFLAKVLIRRIGPFNCPGKGLAMMETRSVIARTVYKYDVLIPDREKFNEEMFYDSIRDHMSIGIPDCVITFKNRR